MWERRNLKWHNSLSSPEDGPLLHCLQLIQIPTTIQVTEEDSANHPLVRWTWSEALCFEIPFAKFQGRRFHATFTPSQSSKSPGGYCLLRIAKEELSLFRETRFRMCRSFNRIASFPKKNVWRFHATFNFAKFHPPFWETQLAIEADQESTGKYRDTQSPTPHP